jgi:hypothetical protein
MKEAASTREVVMATTYRDDEAKCPGCGIWTEGWSITPECPACREDVDDREADRDLNEDREVSDA